MKRAKRYEIISHLRKNTREKLTSLSRKTHVPVSTIFENLKNDFDKYIVKHTCILDFNKIGFNIKANLLLKFKAENKKEGIDYISKNLYVNSLAKVNNGYDLIAEVICKDMASLEEFIEQLELNTKIKKKEVFYVMEDIKREEFFTQPELVRAMIETE